MWMTGFKTTGELSLEGDLLEKAREDFISGRGDEEQVRFFLFVVFWVGMEIKS